MQMKIDRRQPSNIFRKKKEVAAPGPHTAGGRC